MSQYFYNIVIFSRGKFRSDILLFILYKCYLHNIFITNSRWQVVTNFKIDPQLILLFYPSVVAYLWFVMKLMLKCCGLSIFYLIYKKLRFQQLWKYCDNKCYNIFIKHLFSVVVGYGFIFYYFILNYKKLTPQ